MNTSFSFLAWKRLKNFARFSDEAWFVGSTLVREGAWLSLVALAIALSFESILPGTVSVRFAVVFFVFGIALLLLADRRLGKLPLREPERKPLSSLRVKEKFILAGFLLWASFLFGNALIGFPIAILFVILALVIALFLLLFRNAFE